jgi:hypothetical protein
MFACVSKFGVGVTSAFFSWASFYKKKDKIHPFGRKFAQSGHAVPGLDVEKQKNFRLISTQKEKVGFWNHPIRKQL